MTAPVGDGVLLAVEAARQPVHPRAYRAFAVLLGVVLVGLFAGLIVYEGAPSLTSIVGLALLMVAAENRDRLFGDETSISGSITVAIAAIFAFRQSTPLLGPLACAACAGIYWPHIRQKDFSKIVINSTSIGLSALAGALALSVTSPSRSLTAMQVVLHALPVVLAYWVVNSVVLTAASSLLRGGRFVSGAVVLLRSETQMLGFAFGGALCGLLISQNEAWLGTGALVLLLIMIDALVISTPPQQLNLKIDSAVPVLARFASYSGGTAAAIYCSGRFPATLTIAASVLGGLLLLFGFAFVVLRRRSGSWDLALALGVVIADAPLVVLFAAGGLIAAQAGVGIAAGTVAVALTIGTLVGRRLRRRREIDATDEAALLTAIEIALLDGRDVPTLSR